jgi:hypothetical protein
MIMACSHNPPRQLGGRKSVKRHREKSVGTEPNDFTNPAAKPSAGRQAGMAYARAANRAGRPPLK